MKRIVYIILIIILFQPLSAQEQKSELSVQFAYYVDHHKGGDGEGFNAPNYTPLTRPDGYTLPTNDPGRNLGTGWGGLEFQCSYLHNIIFPVLQGSDALTKDNKLTLQIGANLSPVTLNLEPKIVLTPIAFLAFELGGHIGTGWNLSFNGLGLNIDGTGNAATDPFPGAVVKGWFQGTFQFDLAALMPGDYNHVVFSTSHKIKYQMFTAANEGQPWQYMADPGENVNGFLYEASYITGYQIPNSAINFAGFMAETSTRLGDAAELSKISENGWGSDFMTINMGPLFNLQINDTNALLILLQVKNSPVYSDSSIYNNYFVNRSATGKSYWYLNRLALVYSLAL